ncbi:GMC family oxidoreductase N-terminal domain-containing protein [Kocuria rhizophila]|nr:GMC family oxidoreductase N-terminal domain-containing protein [Kocuria rhizophila]
MVVGAGSAGVVVAARPARTRDVTVALPRPATTTPGTRRSCSSTAGWSCWSPATTGTTRWRSRRIGNSFMRMARAKALGGCSSHNSCIAFWAPSEDLDEWELKHGAQGWNSELAFRLYQKLENNEDPGPPRPRRARAAANAPPADPSGVARRTPPSRRGSRARTSTPARP